VRKQARITSKGQITVPHEIRRALGVRPGDKLSFELADSGDARQDRIAVKVRPVRTRSPFEKYRGIGTPGIPNGRKAVLRWIRNLREP
jgi:AbrB family looped-hinge helix DNA binding protein